MPRIHVRKLGARKYRDYTTDILDIAVEKVLAKEISIRQASINYKIPFGTLHNKIKKKHTLSIGGQTALRKEEEIGIIRNVVTCAEWGFPLNILDLRMFTKIYLDSAGRNITKFKNNLPGQEWAYSLLKRHRFLIGQRMATNISRARAEVSPQVITNFFCNLENTIKDVPPSHIFNYDETNVADDPGKKLLLYRRGIKYPEKIMNHSKSATTIMICGSASGVLLPPYVIYRSENMWDAWTKNGLKGYPCCIERCCAQGMRYNRTSHGWMEASCFTDWFESQFLPHAKMLEGRKIVIGDNLASHFTSRVLQLCQEHNIAFVCLPPNSMHICQPLDVAFFRPFKNAWRTVLTEWKLNNGRSPTLQKDVFPSLLSKTLKKMDNKQVIDNEEGSISKNLKSGFSATGVYPFNAQKVLDKIPSGSSVNPDAILETSLVSFLKTQRFASNPRTTTRRKKIRVIPGKSVTCLTSESESSDDQDQQVSDPDMDVSEEIESQMDPEYIEAVPENIMIGTFILAKFMSGRRKSVQYKYICVVRDVIDSKQYEVLGLKSFNGNKTMFKTVESDISTVELDEIVAVLPMPEIIEKDEQLLYQFKFAVDVKEI